MPVRGKCPVVKNWQRHCLNPPADRVLAGWVRQFPAHNVGAACGHLVALDIDDETEDGALAQQARAFRAFGETPLIRIGRAPRRVLLFRADEAVGSVQKKEAQVLARGRQVVLFGLHPTTNQPYTWPRATPLDVPLRELPLITEAGACDWLGRAVAQPRLEKRARTDTPMVAPPICGEGVPEGVRNTFIFAEALGLAWNVQSFDDLLTRLAGINQTDCLPPLPAEEVRRTAHSVWSYRKAGHLFRRGDQAHAIIDAVEFHCLRDEPNAIVLLILLLLAHGARREPFVIVKEAMARDKLIANWSGKMYEHARNVLLERGFIERVREGGGRGNPHGYFLRKPPPTGSQYNQTFFSSPSPSLYVSQEKNARVSISPSSVFMPALAVESAPMLFNADALPVLPTPDEQLRIAVRAFLADRPRGGHTWLAAAVGISSQQLTNWKARHKRLKPASAGMLCDLIGVDRIELPRRELMLDGVPQPLSAEVAGGMLCDRINDAIQAHVGVAGRHAAEPAPAL